MREDMTQKWEYDYTSGDGIFDLLHNLDHMGKAGWELVSIIESKDNFYFAILKRPKEQEDE